MKKPKKKVCLLALVLALWMARPVALADGVDWLMPKTAVPEQGEESPIQLPVEETGPYWLNPDTSPEVNMEDSSIMPPTGVANPEETDWLLPTTEESPPTTQENDQIIDVTVPGSGEVIINPHRRAVELGDSVVHDQIVNNGQILTNNSTIPIIISASVTVDTEESGGLSVTTRPIAEEERQKLAYLYVEFQNVPGPEASAAWSGAYTGAPNQLLASDGGAVSGEVLQIEAGSEAPTYAAYRLFGALSENPETGWQAGDKLSVTVSFTFRPAGERQEAAEPETATEDPPAQKQRPAPDIYEQQSGESPEDQAEYLEVPEPEPEFPPMEVPAEEPEEGPMREEPPEPEQEKMESFASESNPDWLIPPNESGEER